MSSNLQMARTLAQWGGFDHLLPNPGYQAQLPDSAFAKLYSCPLTNDNCINRTIKAISNYSEGNTTVESMIIDQFEQVVPKFKQICSEFVSEQLSGFLSTEEAKEKLISIPEDCLALGCTDINETTVHSRSLTAAEVISGKHRKWSLSSSNQLPDEWKDLQEFLRFRVDDSREKMLFFSTEYDHDIEPGYEYWKALNPAHISKVLAPLASKYDIKYAVVQKYSQICDQVKASIKAGKISHIVIMGHGNPGGILINNVSLGGTENEIRYQDFGACFEGLKPAGKITLLSCATGGEDHYTKTIDNIAQRIADGSKRTVIAPIDLVSPRNVSILNEDTDVFFHKIKNKQGQFSFYNENLFRPFRPHFFNCTSPSNNSQLKREVYAKEFIQKSLYDKLLIPNDPHVSPDQFLGFCEDDPREKFLVLSSHFEKKHWFFNSALLPNRSSFLGILGEVYDLKYRVIHNSDDICKEVQSAKEVGELGGVIIKGYGNSDETAMMLSDSSEMDKQNLTGLSCLSKIKPDGIVVLLGGSLGRLVDSDGENSLAQKMANVTNRTVLATICPIYPESVEVHSTDPLVVSHPSHSLLGKLWTGCYEDKKSLIKEFNSHDE